MRKLLLILSLFISSFAYAQEVVEAPAKPAGMRGISGDFPDISIVGDIVGKTTNNALDSEKDTINLRGTELALQGYIYPQIKANVIIAFHKHEGSIEADVEEAYANFTRVAKALSVKAGKMLVSFGKVNNIHPHHLPFVEQPLAIQNFFGEHGLSLEGASFGYLLPLPFFAQIEAGWGHAPQGHSHASTDAETADVNDVNGDIITVAKYEEHEHTDFSLADKAGTGRLWLSFPLSEKSELETGFSGVIAKGAHFEEHQDDVRMYGLDLTFKLWPSTFNRFILQNEIFYLTRKVPIGDIKRLGLYSYFGYKIDQYWSIGLLYDYAEDAWPHADETGNSSVEISSTAKAGSCVLTRNLTETTYLRGQYKYNFEPEENYEAWLQLCFGLGPHSHPLE
ncbi:MAG: hypothetical protein PHD29_03690 [bacterium]|nr:hypothetical protein [bacterium]MDD5756748.1 hypothetical protein [bacterium]